MTINLANNNPRIEYTVAQGVVQTVFTVPFEYFEDADVSIYVDGVKKSLGADYTLSGGDGSTGVLTFVTAVAPAVQQITGAVGGSEVSIVRDVALERTTDFAASGYINRVALNTQLDTIVAQVADLDDRVSRSLHLNDSVVGPDMLLTDDRKGKIISFNATTGAVETNKTIADFDIAVNAVAVSTAQAVIATDKAAASAASAVLAAAAEAASVVNVTTTQNLYSGDDSTVNFTLPYEPVGVNGIMVYVDGVHQDSNSVSTTGTALIFAEAPPTGTDNIVVRMVATGVTNFTTATNVIAKKEYATVALLLADTTDGTFFNTGDYVTVVDGGFSYKVATVGDVTNAGGIQFDVLAGDDGYNVKAFGAAGDGVTDDTAAIQATVSSAYTSGGGVVSFPNNGTYLVTSPIPLRTNVYLVGPATLKAGSTNNVVGEATPSGAHTNVGVIDLVIDGNSANVSFPSDDADGNALRLNMVSKSVFRNVWVKNSVFNAVSVYNNSNDNFFSDIRITDTGKSGTLPAVYTFNGIFLEAGSSRNQFNNIYINTTRQYGIWVGARDADNFDNQFSNIWIASTFGDGIRVGDEATSNKSARTLFSNISVLSAGDIGIRLYHAGTGSVEEVIITGGQVQDCTNRGILLDTNSIKCKVSSVDFRDNGGYGITNAGTDNSIIGCSSSGHGLDNYTDTGTNTISVGTIPGDGRTGTFTPVVLTGGAAVGRTYSDQFGSYRVNGNRVDYKIRIVLSAVGSSTGALTIGSLPFTSDNPAFETPTITCANLTYTGDVKGLVLNGTTEIKLYSMSSGSGLTGLTDTALASNTEFYISGTYEIET